MSEWWQGFVIAWAVHPLSILLYALVLAYVVAIVHDAIWNVRLRKQRWTTPFDGG